MPDERMAMMRPQPRSRMPGSRTLATATGVSRSSRSAVNQSSSAVASGSTGGGPPALSTAMSMPPYALRAQEVTRLADPGSAASAATVCTSVPARGKGAAAASRRPSSRDQRTSRQPSSARSEATTAPRPEVAPPTSARLPSRPKFTSAPLQRAATPLASRARHHRASAAAASPAQ
jgi:hypothetical protein